MTPIHLNRTARAGFEHNIDQSSRHNQHYEGQNGSKGVNSRRDAPPSKSTPTPNQEGSGDLEEAQANDDEEDGSVNQELAEDDDEDPEVIAPSHGINVDECDGNGKLVANGKPSKKKLNDHGAGLSNSGLLAAPVTPSKKRRLSNLSNASVLDASADEISSFPSFPRKKKPRRLSNDGHGLLTYSAMRHSAAISNVPDVAVESSDDDDDDAIYQAVNLISDDEDDEPGMEKLEEEVIMSTETNSGHDALFASLSGDIFDSLGGNIFGTPDRQLGQLSDFPFGETDRHNDGAKRAETRKYSNGSTKRVRFWDEQSADEDSSSTASSLDRYPDIFVDQDSLPPPLQQLIEHDDYSRHGNQSGSDGEASYWASSDDDRTSLSQGPINKFVVDDDDDDDSTSSGYDSDEGSTTDEEFSTPSTINQAKTLLHRSSSSDSDKNVSPRKPFVRNRTKPGKSTGPRWGHFAVDPTKATAFTDGTGRRVIVHPPQIPSAHSRFFPGSAASSSANSPLNSLLFAAPGEESDFGELTPQNVTNPRDIMFGGIFGMPQDVGNLLKGQVIGPPEAFFPFVSLDSNGNPIDEEDEYTEDGDDDDDDIDLDSFLALPEGMEEEEDDVLETPSQAPLDSDFAVEQEECPQSTPLQRKRSVGETMLEHFDRTPGVVSSFRSNQDMYRKISSQHPNPDFRASNSQAVRFGKSAETPITPVRKRGSISRRSVHQVESPLLRQSNGRRSGPRMGTFT